ncbi:MAG TPA: C1 family peptidase [Terriglobales bacterium]|nr:C1 family peptidase [Terriglobales bacterium]
MNKFFSFFVIIICSLVFYTASAQQAQRQVVKYEPKYKDPVDAEIKEKDKQAKKEQEAKTDAIRAAQEKSKEQKEKEEKEIRFDFTWVQKPASIDAFQKTFHFEPLRQYLSGTCWCFSTTSFFESEVNRLTGQKIKLSEMFTVYYEYLEKARRYVQERGESYFDEGSEGNVVMLVWRKYGIVPAEAYKGELDPDGRYDHSEMIAEMSSYLDQVKEKNLWDEELVVASLSLIMDKYMGRPPASFVYKGVQMTPQQFLAKVLKLNLDDYVSVMSTLSQPFYAYGEYAVAANWWHSRDYYNVPLDNFYQIIKYAIQNGYSVRLNGDITEPGFSPLENAAVIPSFDIPLEYIDQGSREFRVNNKSTSDDHDIHLVGYTRVGDYDWFLIKDSYAPTLQGEWKGYYFYREDYIKLKMLTYIVHKDAVKSVIKDFR